MRNELTFNLIVESAPYSFIIVNDRGLIAYVNTQTEKLFGFERKELIGKTIEILVPDRFRSGHPGLREGFMKNPTARSMGVGRDLYAKRKDGSEFPVEIGLNPIVTMEGTMVLAAVIDITERKGIEENFRKVVESAPNAMILVNQSGKIILVNAQTERLFGYERDELIGNEVEVLIPGRFGKKHPDFRNLFFQNPELRAMGQGRELYALKKDGSEVPVEIGLNPIEASNGQLVLASIIDITERRIRQDLDSKRLQLEIRNKELEQLAYIASHDLQEPLRTITNYINILNEDYLAQLPGVAAKYLKDIDTAAGRMRKLVGSLLNYSRLGKDREFSQVDISKVLREVKSDLAGIISETKAEFKFDQLPIVNGSENDLRQLFQNLISNALKFRKKGTKPVIEINCRKGSGGWQFSIQDNGIGIDQKHFNRIFQIFQRLHPQAKYEGDGLGLAYCKKIVDLHKGDLWVESKLNKGSTFYFTIGDQI